MYAARMTHYLLFSTLPSVCCKMRFCRLLLYFIGTRRRGFTIRLKTLKPRAPDFGRPQILGVRTISSIFVSNYICIFLNSMYVFYYALFSVEKLARRTEVNDDEHSLFMALRIGSCYA